MPDPSTSSPGRPVAAVVALAVLGIALGALPLLIRGDVPATHLVATRVTLGAAVLVPALWLTNGPVVPRSGLGRLFVLAVVLTLHWLTFFLAIKLTTVAVALAAVYLGPVAAAALSGPVLGETVGRKAVAGLVLALAGTLLVVRPGGGMTAAGLAAGALSGMLFAAFMIVGKPVADRLGGLVVAAWELVFASVLLAPFTVQAIRVSSDAWPRFLLLGAVFTGLAGVVYWSSMRQLPVAVVGVIMYLEPASAVVWAAVVLGEMPDAAGWIGVALVIAGGVLASMEASEEVVVGASTAL